MDNKVAVVIPYYRNELTITEKISLNRLRKILWKFPFYFVSPYSLVVDKENFSTGETVIYVPDNWMDGIKSYNQMMICIDFYRIFEKYTYILLHQLDAYVFSDRLEEFCSYGYDYIGAPWIEGKFDIDHAENGIVYVGNGGFSLRKVSACISVLEKTDEKKVDYNEDLFWGSRNSNTFKVAPVSIAMDFSFERPVRLLYEKNGRHLPFGCHAWMRYDFNFLKPYLVHDGYSIVNTIKAESEYDRSNDYRNQNFMSAHEQEILTAIDSLIGFIPNKVYIYGAGEKGRVCGYLLKKQNKMKIIYLDKNEQKWGKGFFDIPVVPPQSIVINNETIIILAVNKPLEVKQFLEKLGFQTGKNVIESDSFITELSLLTKGYLESVL